ncbi:hypothetical protein HO133_009867 [Letharia lupina]|uniref:Uncharacterized protein n=1 Tax=Letharia lupina TaxID=560253 RepID=A0A8H6CM04_9LECA|nr:uncharacterized protein HO133_009867 [Letharia lupina]KAF6225865.1 hypothetical protein HO133_009867 [Letharia lupina]
MTSNPNLYGLPRPRTSKPTKPTPSSNAAFTSALSSLLALPSPSTTTTPGRARPSRSKPDIFTAHNKGAKKRALADISGPQSHARTSDAVDAATLHRSKRKMEDKARLYASMKRGDYVPPADGGTNKEENALVDFDRKWAEADEAGEAGRYETESDDGGDSVDDGGEGEERVEYEDEFGRLRHGTRASASRELRRRDAAAHAEEELGRMRARPARPEGLIVGDTIQAAAFNPAAAGMEALARKRDRSLTPPEEVHYDAGSEDGEGRRREMDALGREREETERGRREGVERRERRRGEVEERKRVIAKKRGERLAERFLNGLDVP